MIIISGVMEISAGSADVFEALSRDLVTATRLEPGCAEYRFARSIDDPNVFEIFEEFDDETAMREHVRADHYRAWGRAVRDLDVVRVAINRYDAPERVVLR